MEQRPLGVTGLTVGRLALGTMGWGRATDIDDAESQVRLLVDAGGNLVDTADSYGDGMSETMLGKVLADPGLRSAVIVASKAGRVRGGLRRANTSRASLIAAIDASLARLGVDHVDLWQVDVWDTGTPLAETLDAISTVVRSGRARYAGVCDFTGWQLGTASALAQGPPHHLPISVTQVEYSLVQRGIEREVVPCATFHGIGILAAAPLGRGVLTGKYRHGTPPDSRGASESLGGSVRQYLDIPHRRIVDGVAMAAEGLGVSPTEVALAWVRDCDGVVAPVVGARTHHQWRTALASEGLTLPAAIRSVLDEVSAPVLGYPNEVFD